MKKILLLVLVISVFASCDDKKNKADANGTFESNSTTISAENAGKLISFIINEGDILKRGDIIGIIDTTQLNLKKMLLSASFTSIKSQSESVLSQIDVLEEQLRLQNINLKRIKNMFTEGSATQKQLDDIEGAVKITKQQIISVRAQNASVLSKIDALEVQLLQVDDLISKSIITNPINGTVLIKYVEPFEFVGPGKPLYQIQSIGTLKLKAYIIEPQLTSIKLGQNVKVAVDSENGELTFDGKITWISSQAEFTPKVIQTKDERKNLVYAIKIEVVNDGSLKIGMPASVYFK